MRGHHTHPRRRATTRLCRWLVVLLGTALIAAACGSGEEPGTAGAGASGQESADGSGGILRIAMSAGNVPQPTTPPSEGGEGLRFVGMTIYDGLTKFDLDQGETLPTPEPALAESWEVSEDELTWTFHLRDGVTFHDGTPFDAQAVDFQFNRMKNPDFEHYDELNAPKHAEQYRTIASWEVIDDHTIAITTTAPNAWLDWSLAQIMLPSPTAVETYGNEDYAQHASGTGPFKMVRYVDGEVMELEANEDYWNGRPKLDGIVLYPQPEASSRTASLQSGEVDWAEVPAPDSLPMLESDGFQIHLTEYPHAILIGFNQFREPLTDIRVRQALNYAADREGLATILNGVGVPATQYVPSFHPAHAEGVGFEYDPDKARELLADAGYEDGELTLELAYTINGSGNMYPNPMVEKLQQDFAAVGVELELTPFEWGAFTELARAGLEAPENADYDLIWRSPGAGMLPNYFGRDWLCDRPGDLQHIFGYCNPEVDALYAEAAATFDADASNALLAEAEALIVEDAAALFWMHDLNLRVTSEKVHGYIHPRSWYVDFTTIWVEE